MGEEAAGVQARLAEPFPAQAVSWKAQTASGNRALAVAYIDARDVMDRLDAVVGAANWQDCYDVLPDGSAVCRLSLRVGGEWITKSDVGGESEQKDEGDRRKASFSDALKRAAVKWGVGRYLYSLPKSWVGYDPTKRQLTETPSLPAWALPRAEQPQPRGRPQAPKAVPPGPVARGQGAAAGGGAQAGGGPAGPAPVQGQAAPKLTPPSCEGMEPDHTISRDHAAYLKQQIEAKGYSVAAFRAKRGVRSLLDITYGAYGVILGQIEAAPPAEKGDAA